MASTLARGRRSALRGADEHRGLLVWVAALALLVVALVVVGVVTKIWTLLIALSALLAVLAIGAVAMGVMARRATEDDPAVKAVPESEREQMPGVFMTGEAGEAGASGEDDTAVGDTAEAHDEINPHDLPVDHPGREAAEEQARGEAGTTRGDEERAQAAPARGEREDEPGA
jgi:hypothetical protein